ncbi:MAG: ROK family protein [candidate division Zixibacteria bacterium]|nr:ROK family protein [candidate division Zixibacteria bacterium]
MPDKKIYAGIDIGGTNIKFGLIDSNGNILHREHRPTMAEKGAGPLLHLITNIAERLLYFAAEEDYAIKYVGVGSPGAVDYRTGRVIGPCPNIDGWQGTEIGATLSERLNTPVYVDNDANAMALAEARFGAAAGARSAICVTVGTGIGGGVIIDGRVMRGASSSAGELGHMTINFDGPKCNCGNKGCLEMYCSSQAMIDGVKAKTVKGLSPRLEEVLEGDLGNLTIKKLFAAARKGDEIAGEVIRDTAVYLGIGLSGIVNVFNPEVVVVGGGIIDGGAGFLEVVTAEIRKRAFSSAVSDLRVVKASLGNAAGFIGAGLLGDAEH